jgi:hypothetical protein
MNALKIKLKIAALGVAFFAGISAGTASAALEKGATNCENGACSWSLLVDGAAVMNGMYSAQSDGTLFIDAGMMQMTRMDLADGGFISLNGVNGNIDPILGFSASAGTGASGHTFAFNFSLPIALSGNVQANSSVSYSLTALSSAGAQITPLFGHTVIAQDVDTSVGGLPPINKGVDVGNTFFILGQGVGNSPVFTASNVFPVTFDYDTMSATIAFSLSAQSQVGMSGFVEQVTAIQQTSVVPEPSIYALLCAGLGLLGFIARRQRSA